MGSAPPRIPLLAPDEARRAAEGVGISAPMAELNIFRVLLRHPQLAKRINDLLMQLIFKGRLDGRLRELVIMRLGWATGSDYEWTQHWRVARQLGVSEQDLLAVRDWRASERFGPVERAVLAATDETLEQGRIAPQTWRLCEELLGDADVLIDLVVAIGNWRMIASLLLSLEIPVEEGTPSWPPDGKRPRGV